MEESGVRLSSEKNEVDLLMETAALALRQCMVEMERVYVLARCYKTKYLEKSKDDTFPYRSKPESPTC
uniref:MEIS N-terminal domain-containing protein n=1 Tax=Caenorhabditis japonica TaxID=281687 RepID=A0A8R1DNS8_CAEJA